MAEQGHGNHWECIDNLDNILQKVLPGIIQEGTKVEKAEILADCFENEKPNKHTIFSITNDSELTTFVLIAKNQKKRTNEIISIYPFIQYKGGIKLQITQLNERENLVEAVVTGKTEDEHLISFFDTKYFTQKEKYKVGETYTFSISALGYEVEVLKEKSFSFKGQDAVDWLAKIGKQPTYDELGNVKPVEFGLTELVAFLPTNKENPDDVEFQSPINSIETIKAFDKEFYRINITIFRDPDVCIDLYTKTSFFDIKPTLNDAIRGIIWLQGHKI